ncbi:MAG: hypothetical protein IJV40_10720 [Oscillospiraceae bacterium]|nr:hypothetical protein [Oscillospiraceae bacterium]
MSNRERIMQIVDRLPEYKLTQILVFLQGIQFDDDLEDDLFCEKLYQRYLEDDDPEKHNTISLEDLAAREGIAL